MKISILSCSHQRVIVTIVTRLSFQNGKYDEIIVSQHHTVEFEYKFSFVIHVEVHTAVWCDD